MSALAWFAMLLAMLVEAATDAANNANNANNSTNGSMAAQDEQSVLAEVADGWGKLLIAMVCLGLIVLAVGVLLCVCRCHRRQSEGNIGPLCFRTIH